MTPAAVGILVAILAYVTVAVRAGHHLWTATREQVRARGFEPTAWNLFRELAPWLIGCAIWPAMTIYAIVRKRG